MYDISALADTGKVISPDQAAALVQSGDTIYIGSCTSYARGLTDALAHRSTELENVTLATLNIAKPFSILECENPKHFKGAWQITLLFI